MHKNLFKKGLVVGIIFLFIGINVISSTGKINIAISKTRGNDGSLLGYVNDTSGNPIEGALVRVHFHETYEEDISDEDGYYQVTNIPICYCMKNATCSKDGYKSEWELLSIAEDTTLDFILTYINNPPSPPLMWTEDFTTFYILFVDPEGDDIWFFIDWGDGTPGEWIGPYESGIIVSISHDWLDEGVYQFKLKARDLYGESQEAVYSLILSPNFKFFYPLLGYVDTIYKFTIYLEDYGFFMFDFGDGTYSDWITGIAEKSYSSPGAHKIKWKAKDISGYETPCSDPILITILTLENHPPNIPIIAGPSSPKLGVNYTYEFYTTDPEDDNVSYYIDWGDGNIEDWIGPYSSGEVIALSHAWYKSGWYTLRCKAKDHPYEDESDWLEIIFKVPPKSKENVVSKTSDSKKDCIECQSNGKTHLAEKLLNRLEKDKVLSNVINSNNPDNEKPICKFLNKTYQKYHDFFLYLLYLADTLPYGSKIKEIYALTAYIIATVVLGYIFNLAYKFNCFEFVS